MKSKTYSFWTLVTYGLVLVAPVFFVQFIHINANQNIQLATIAFIVGAVLLLTYLKKSQPLALEKKQLSTGKAIAWGLAGIPLSLTLQLLILQIEQQFFGQQGASANTQNIVSLIQENMIFILATTIAGPIMEELVFRRAIFGTLHQRFGFIVPALLSSALFSLAHNDGHYLLYGGLGIFFCWLYQHTGKIWTSMLTHVGMNLLVVVTQLAVHANLPH